MFIKGKTILLENEDGISSAQELLTFLPAEKWKFLDAKHGNTLQNRLELISRNYYESIETHLPFEHLEEFATELCSISIKEQVQNEDNESYSIVEDDLVQQMQHLVKEDCFGLDNDKERQKKSLEEHVISLMFYLLKSKQTTSDSEDEMSVVNHIDNDESLIGDSLVIGQLSYEEYQNEEFVNALITKTPFKRHFTLASDISEPLLECEISHCDLLQIHKYNNIKDQNSLNFDENMAENIRLKMLASSLSEAESNILEVDMWNQIISNNKRTEVLCFNVSTTLTDTAGTSSDTDSTIIVDVAKLTKENEIHEIKTENVRINEIESEDRARSAARRMTFQRGNVLRIDSTPDEKLFLDSEDEQQSIFKRKSEFYSKG